MVQKLNTAKKRAIIGLTGIFGCGKSTVANMMQELDVFVVDADKLAHEALLHGSAVFEKIYKDFKEAYSANDKAFDRKKLAAIIFKDGQKRQKLESIVHPYVFERILDEIGESGEDLAVVEVPLLYESGFDQFCDSVIVVQSTNEAIEKRLKEKGFSKQEITERLKAQISLKEKLKRAKYVIDNSGDFDKTRKEVQKILKQIRTDAKGA